MRKPELSIPTLLGLGVTIVGLVVGVLLLSGPLRQFVNASPEEIPEQIKITNITDNSFVVSWITQKTTSGFIQYGENDNPELVVSDDRDQEKGSIGSYMTHFVTVRGLKSATKYAFRVGSGKGLYDQDKTPYAITTGANLRKVPASDVAYGQALFPSGDPAEGAIVYLQLPGIVPQAALVKPSGSWVIPLSTARTSDLTSFAAYDKDKDIIELFVQAASLGTATVTTTTGNDSPVPPITLGTSQNLIAAKIEPTAVPTPYTSPSIPLLNSGEGSPKQGEVSKFSGVALAPATENVAAGTIEILTPKFGEKVNTQQPIIQGKAPANSEIQVTVESSKKFESIVVANDKGEWAYAVPEDLEPGDHTVTVSTIINGVVKKVKKTFVVEAAEKTVKPAFSASPSAILKPTPTKKPTPTPIPRVVYPDTSDGVPTSGSLTPTLIFIILGTALTGVGLYGYKRYATI